MHLNIAVCRSLVNRRNGQLKTHDFGSEIVYHCTPTHSINSAIDHYGLKNCKNAFFAVFVEMQDAQVAHLKQEIAQTGAEELKDLNRHLDWQDHESIVKMFDIKDRERELMMPYALLTSLYNKLALKNI